jgi:hypothetical protein
LGTVHSIHCKENKENTNARTVIGDYSSFYRRNRKQGQDKKEVAEVLQVIELLMRLLPKAGNSSRNPSTLSEEDGPGTGIISVRSIVFKYIQTLS